MLSNAYGIEATPTAILISPEGKIAAVASTSQLNSEVLKKLLSGQKFELPPTDEFELTSAVPKHHSFLAGKTITQDDLALVRLAIAPTTNEGVLISGTNQVESTGSGLRDLLSYAYDIPPHRIVIPSLLADERYELQAWVPPDASFELKKILQTAVLATAGAEAKVEQRTEDAFVVDGLPGRLAESRTERPSSRCVPGALDAEAVPLELLTSCVGQTLNRTVLLPLGFDGRYSFQLRWNASNPTAIETALKQQLGLTLKRKRQASNFLAVIPLKR